MEEKSNDKNQQNEEPNAALNRSIAPNQMSATIGDETPAQKRSQVAEQPKMRLSMERLTAIGIIIAPVTGAFIYSQFRALVDQNTILSSQAISASAGAVTEEMNTRKQLANNERVARAAQQSVIAIQQQMRQDQRPWIRVDVRPNKASVSGPITATIVITNTGKTPALRVNSDLVVVTPLSEQPPDFKFTEPHDHYNVGVLVPNAPAETLVGKSQYRVGTKEPTPIRASQTDIQDLNNGTTYFAVYGTVKYLDVFNRRHWTDFCVWTPSPEHRRIAYNARKCSEYNNVDNN